MSEEQTQRVVLILPSGALEPNPPFRELTGDEDQKVIDGGVHLGAYAAEFTGELGRLTTTGNLRNYASIIGIGVVALLAWFVIGRGVL